MCRDFWPTLYYVAAAAVIVVVTVVVAVVAAVVAEMQFCVCNLCLIHTLTHSSALFCTVGFVVRYHYLHICHKCNSYIWIRVLECAHARVCAVYTYLQCTHDEIVPFPIRLEKFWRSLYNLSSEKIPATPSLNLF